MILEPHECERLTAAARAARDAGQVRRRPWCVITGAPGSGKTTVLRQLANLGYTTVPDPARAIIEEEVLAGDSPISSRRDVTAFQWRVLERSLENMQGLDERHAAFFDYGIAECLAFLKGARNGWEDEMVNAIVHVEFSKIFILDLVTLTEEDAIRMESHAVRRRLQQLIQEIYTAIGADVVRIPFETPSARVARVLDHVGYSARASSDR